MIRKRDAVTAFVVHLVVVNQQWRITTADVFKSGSVVSPSTF